jgi:glyoxylase-like metal-dependent hydrolase (beta-lactamase superfamily II)
VTIVWERLADGVFRCRLPFLDVTVGLVYGRAGAVLIDSGTALTEARSIARDVRDMADREVGHIMLTHNHFDHTSVHPLLKVPRSTAPRKLPQRWPSEPTICVRTRYATVPTRTR